MLRPSIFDAGVVLVVSVVEAEHLRHVLDGLEPFDGPTGNALRRRIGRDEIRILRFERFQLVEKTIELLVGDLGRVVDVVALFVVADLVAKLLYALERLHLLNCRGGWRLEVGGS